MKDLRQVLLGLVAALLTTAIVLGSLSMTIAESRLVVAILATPTFSGFVSPVFTLTLPPTETRIVVMPLVSSLSSVTPAPSFTPSASPTLPPTPINCPPPPGWSQVVIQPGDTLASLAAQYGITSQELAHANCLTLETLRPGTYIYVPGVPPTQPPVQCGPPPNWVFYTVRQGEYLLQISRAFGITVAQLKWANCLTSDLIRAGQKLYVPNVPTRTPTSTLSPTQPPLPTATLTPLPSATFTQPPPATHTSTLPPPATFTHTPPPPPVTNTFTPTPTHTETPISTPTGTFTPSATSTSTATTVPLMTPTETPTPSPTTIPMPSPSATQTPTPTTPTSEESL